MPVSKERSYGVLRPIRREHATYPEALVSTGSSGDGGELDASVGQELHCQDSIVSDAPLHLQESVGADSYFGLVALWIAREEQGQRS